MQVKYICDFCDMISSDIEEMKIHEKGCFDNPEAKSCGTCCNKEEDFLGDRHFFSCKNGKYKAKRIIEIKFPCDEWEREENEVY